MFPSSFGSFHSASPIKVDFRPFSGDVELRRVTEGQKRVQVVSFLPFLSLFLLVLRELRGEAEKDFLFWV